MKIITPQKVQKNMIAVVYNACQSNHNGVEGKPKRMDGRPAAPRLSFKGGLFRGELKCREEEMSFFVVIYKTPQVLPVSSASLQKRKMAF